MIVATDRSGKCRLLNAAVSDNGRRTTGEDAIYSSLLTTAIGRVRCSFRSQLYIVDADVGDSRRTYSGMAEKEEETILWITTNCKDLGDSGAIHEYGEG